MGPRVHIWAGGRGWLLVWVGCLAGTLAGTYGCGGGEETAQAPTSAPAATQPPATPEPTAEPTATPIAMTATVVMPAEGPEATGGEASDEASDEAALIAEGERLFAQHTCAVCHQPGQDTAIGAEIEGLAGSEVTLVDGTKVTADEAYLRESILQPKAKVVAGYSNVMPVYEGALTEAEVDALVAYILSRGSGME